MKSGSSRLGAHFPHLLLLVTGAELAIYRLLVPGLRPRADSLPPWWHTGLTYLGLFLFYFASVLAVFVVAHQLQQIASHRDRYPRPLTVLLSLCGSAFLVLAFLSTVVVPSAGMSFAFEAAFVASVALIVIGQLFRRGDLGARLGLFLVAVPLVLHFYAPLSVRYIGGEEARWNGLVDEVEYAGRWLVLFAALTMPYCFGARPFFQRSARIAPLMAALGAGFFGAIVVRHDYSTGLKLAQNGLGFAVEPAAPSSLIALCLLALAAVTWTLVNCLGAPAPHRRLIGVGLGLVVVGGYGFAWPLQFLVGLCGLLAISRGASEVQAEERVAVAPTVPPIDDEVWQRFMDAVLERLRERSPAGAEQATAVTIRGEGGQSRTHLVCPVNDVPVTMTVERVAGAIIGLDVRCGDGDVVGEPVWSLHSRRTSRNGIPHPVPPRVSGSRVVLGDKNFSEQFHVAERRPLSEGLLDEARCARLVDEMPGWVAIWESGVLRSQIYPGRGAPFDRPVPIPALASGQGEASPDGVVSLVELLASMARASTALEGER